MQEFIVDDFRTRSGQEITTFPRLKAREGMVRPICMKFDSLIEWVQVSDKFQTYLPRSSGIKF